MRVRAQALACALACLAACGLDVTGSAVSDLPDGGASDIAVRDASAPERDADRGDASDASTLSDGWCAALRVTDPSVRKCIDFDDPQTRAAPMFGFDNVTTTASQVMRLEPSVLGATARDGLTVGLRDGSGSRNAQGHFHALQGPAFPAPNRVVLDFDMEIDELSLQYAAIATFQVAGSGCSVYSGFAVRPDGLRRIPDPGGTSIRSLPLGVPFHVQMIGNPRAGGTSEDELIVDGVSLGTNTINYNPTCNYAGVVIGTFFTSVASGTIRARFDQIVLRVQ